MVNISIATSMENLVCISETQVTHLEQRDPYLNIV